ncbi:MAG: hypothetical protein P8N20_06910, partial [Flavobacteriaceae bacterium]|nr:hypothetical protein [Flavobacteriaceae bacterium]
LALLHSSNLLLCFYSHHSPDILHSSHLQLHHSFSTQSLSQHPLYCYPNHFIAPSLLYLVTF